VQRYIATIVDDYNEARGDLVLQQGYIDGYSATVVFHNKAQHAGNGLSPCQVL